MEVYLMGRRGLVPYVGFLRSTPRLYATEQATRLTALNPAGRPCAAPSMLPGWPAGPGVASGPHWRAAMLGFSFRTSPWGVPVR
eukprot:2352970-Pyramimonas_sp.AAC.1